MNSNKIFKASVVDEYLSGEIWDNVFLVNMPVTDVVVWKLEAVIKY